MARPSARDVLIDAAEAVVMEVGAGNLTLDAVAQKAGISKGGLLYHFPSKDALLQGMVARLIERGRDRRAQLLEKLPAGPSQHLKSEILAQLNAHDATDKVKAALLAAVANNPNLMETIKTFHTNRFAPFTQDASRFAAEALLLLAADGLFLLELLQVSPFTPKQRKALVEELVRQADTVTAQE